MLTIPTFTSNLGNLDRAWRIAVGDLLTNTTPYQDGLLKEKGLATMAGLDYNTPWTRDAAMNSWNCVGLTHPEVARNTLLSALELVDSELRIGDQYWDAIVWTTGAWQFYLYTGDADFLKTAYEATVNSLRYFEATEFDPERVLFRGAASTSDGVAGYPNIYAETVDGSSCILDWPAAQPEKRHPVGFGIPMHALSTNCLYYNAYRVASWMERELGLASQPAWEQKARALCDSINEKFWMPEAGRYRYLIDPLGDCNREECLGHGYAIMFGVAGPEREAQIYRNLHRCEAGMPVLWPTYERYQVESKEDYGRHSGCVWPPFEAMLATAGKAEGHREILEHVLFPLAEYAVRDNQFVEIYHPDTGAIYGGVQENFDIKLYRWKSTDRQTWSATGYMRMLLLGVYGMQFAADGLRFAPTMIEGLEHCETEGLSWRGRPLSISLKGEGKRIVEFKVNGKPQPEPFIPVSDAPESYNIEIAMG